MIKIIFIEPTNYREMLNKIAIFSVISSAIYFYFLSKEVPILKKFVEWANQFTTIKQLGVNIPVGYFIIPIIIGIISISVQLHDRISDLLRLRFNFDVTHILVPMAHDCGAIVNKKDIRISRNKLMSTVFYQYASSTEPKIDKHQIHKALSTWTWFWVFTESIFLGTITLIILLLNNSIPLVLYVLVALLIKSLLCLILYNLAKRNAKSQIKSILSVDSRLTEIKEQFYKCTTK